MEFILVGNGSMGSRYSKYLSENICNKSNICIVDNNQKMINSLIEDGFTCLILYQKFPKI